MPTDGPRTDLPWFRRVAANAENTWVGRNWPSMEAMRRDGIGAGLVEKRQHEPKIRRYLDVFQPTVVVELLDRLVAAEVQVRQLREALARIAAWSYHHKSEGRVQLRGTMRLIHETAVAVVPDWGRAAGDGAAPAAVSDEQRECDRACTSGCHADDCEHHAHIPAPAAGPALGVERLAGTGRIRLGR